MNNLENLILSSLCLFLTYKLIDNALNKGSTITLSKGDAMINIKPMDGFIINPLD